MTLLKFTLRDVGWATVVICILLSWYKDASTAYGRVPKGTYTYTQLRPK